MFLLFYKIIDKTLATAAAFVEFLYYVNKKKYFTIIKMNFLHSCFTTFALIFCLFNKCSIFVICSSSSSDDDDDDEKETSSSLSLIAQANDKLCFRLLHQLEVEMAEAIDKKTEEANLENLFISPLSISSLLVMLMANTGNETYLQIRNALGFVYQVFWKTYLNLSSL